jgi:hypothetical protein
MRHGRREQGSCTALLRGSRVPLPERACERFGGGGLRDEGERGEGHEDIPAHRREGRVDAVFGEEVERGREGAGREDGFEAAGGGGLFVGGAGAHRDDGLSAGDARQDDGGALDDAVDGDGEATLDGAGGGVLEELGAGAREGEVDEPAAEGALAHVRPGLRRGHVLVGEDGGALQQEGAIAVFLPGAGVGVEGDDLLEGDAPVRGDWQGGCIRLQPGEGLLDGLALAAGHEGVVDRHGAAGTHGGVLDLHAEPGRQVRGVLAGGEEVGVLDHEHELEPSDDGEGVADAGGGDGVRGGREFEAVAGRAQLGGGMAQPLQAGLDGGAGAEGERVRGRRVVGADLVGEAGARLGELVERAAREEEEGDPGGADARCGASGGAEAHGDEEREDHDGGGQEDGEHRCFPARPGLAGSRAGTVSRRAADGRASRGARIPGRGRSWGSRGAQGGCRLRRAGQEPELFGSATSGGSGPRRHDARKR